MPRFFVKKEDIYENTAVIRGEDAYHIARSLRMAEGDEIVVCDDAAVEYSCTLTKIRDEECVASVLSVRNGGGESPVKITLCMGYPKGDKLEQVIQKAVELGAYKIIPFESSRCIKRPKADREEKQIARMQRIALEAAKQCGRSIIPSVERTVSFEKMVDSFKGRVVLFCYEGEGARSLREVVSSLSAADEIFVVIGSEGGFSKDEAALARDAGAHICNLGPRILRCETAPAYVLSALSYHFEL